ncbi:hypothetical protein Moror_6105 [Moniliophthora roreri MCA 2997]|uniref:Uncharacterized protein n=2 Tax=Moniliophthora roreri TaxID=221103 RepID=V2WCK9_MONRO|nr:hypothetical protein Moror_6105 [Moniliophthora roreri MCA 2997]
MQRIDDSDLSRISYTDGWRQKTGSTAHFNFTDHVTNVTDSQAVFRFLGTYVEVHGELRFVAGQHADLQKLVFYD